MAWGIKHLLDSVPFKYGVAIRQDLIGHFGKTMYYRIYREERMLLPADQEYIRKLFQQYGIEEEPRFEKNSDEYYYG